MGSPRSILTDSWPNEHDALYRYRSEEVEIITGALLRHFGDPDARTDGILPTWAFVREHGLGKDSDVVAFIVEVFGAEIEAASPGGPFDIDRFSEQVSERFGLRGRKLALQFLHTVAASQHVSPWNSMRRRDWVDELDLAGLFGSEDVSATYGTLFDQRFIDFLHRSLEELDRVNWRKFEALTGEWFARLGWHVELGPGRGDGGVDVRAWPSADASTSEPAVFIAQCKRQKRHVEQVVVKALHADTLHEGASRGLIVTTSTVSPGASHVIHSRDYPIEVVERSAIHQWIKAMRTPGTGLWLPE